MPLDSKNDGKSDYGRSACGKPLYTAKPCGSAWIGKPMGNHYPKSTEKRKGVYTKKVRKLLILFVVRPAGIEPAAYSLGGCRSIQLSYERISISFLTQLDGCQVFKSCPLLWNSLDSPTLDNARAGLNSIRTHV